MFNNSEFGLVRISWETPGSPWDSSQEEIKTPNLSPHRRAAPETLPDEMSPTLFDFLRENKSVHYVSIASDMPCFVRRGIAACLMKSPGDQGSQGW